MNKDNLNDLIDEFEARQTPASWRTHLKILAWITLSLAALLAAVRVYSWLVAVDIP